MGGMTDDRFGGMDGNRRRARRPRRRAGIESRLERLEDRRLLADGATIAANFGDFYLYEGEKQNLLRSGRELVIQFQPGQRDVVEQSLLGNGGPLAGFTREHVLGTDGAVYVRPEFAGVSQTDQVLSLMQISGSVEQFAGIVGASVAMMNADATDVSYVTNLINVGLKSGVDAAAFFAGMPEATTWRMIRGSKNEYVVELGNLVGIETVDFAADLNGRDGVAFAEPNGYLFYQKLALPNDPLLNLEWQLRNTGQTGGTPGADINVVPAWNQGITGQGVVIAILDDGVQRAHPDLAANIFYNNGDPIDGIDNDGNGFVDDHYGWDFAANDNDPNPLFFDDAHGTAVAGLAAAVGDNGIGVAGGAYDAQILAIRLPFNGEPTTSTAFIEGVYYAAGIGLNGANNWRGADVLNASYGTNFGPSTAEGNAWMAAYTQGRNGLGTLNFASSGNSGIGRVAWPSAYPSVISVGGSDYDDTRVNYSQYGSALELMAPTGPLFGAPGEFPLTTDLTGSSGYNDFLGGVQYPTSQVSLDYTTFNGTSASSPIAAGAGALAVAARPGLTAAQIRAVLINTAAKIGNVTYVNGFNPEYGYGRIDIGAAISDLLLFQVISTTPANGSTPTSVPTELVATFSRAVDMTTVSASDLSVLAPLGLTVTVGTPVLVSGTLNQVSFPLTFDLGDSQISTGLIQYAFAANSMFSTDGRPLQPYAGNFLVPLADLTLLPEPVVPTMTLGQESTFLQQITLNGPEFTTGVTLMTQLPQGLNFVRASTERGTVWYDAALHRVYVKAGNFLPAGIVEVSMTVRPVQAGQFRLTSDAYSDSLEIISSTNHIEFPVTVVDVPGVLRFSKTGYTVTEEPSPHIVEFPVTRQEGSLGDATVTVKAIDGTGIAGVDYELLTPTLTFPNGDRSPQNVQVRILTTSEWFASRTFSLELTDVSGATLGFPDVTNVTILDSQPAPVGTIVFKGGTPNPVSESGGFITVEVERVDGLSKQLAVTLATANGTAIAGTNFGTKGSTAQFSQLVTWSEGEMGSKFVNIPILQDGVFTPSALDFQISVSPANADTTITGLTSESIFIVNTTQTSNVGFNPVNYQVLEDAGSITVTVTRTIVPLANGVIPALTVNFATANGTALAGVDYVAAAGTLNWSAGDTSPKTITIGIIDKPTTELDRNFFVNLSGVSLAVNGTITAGQAQVIVKDTDIDATGPKIGAVQFSGTSSSISQIFLTFSEPLDVASATNGSNYLIRSAGGETSLISGVQYLSSSNSVIVNLPAGSLKPNTFYTLTVNGTAPNGVKDIFGNLLDGAGTNGTNYVTSFMRGTSATYVDDMNNRVTIGLRNGGFFDLTRFPSGQGQWLAIYDVTSRSVLSGSVRRLSASSSGYTRIDTLSGIGNPWFIRVTMTTPPFYVNRVLANNPPLPGGVAPVGSKLAVKKLRTPAPARVVRGR